MPVQLRRAQHTCEYRSTGVQEYRKKVSPPLLVTIAAIQGTGLLMLRLTPTCPLKHN